MTTTLKIHPFSMPLTELSAVIHFLTGVRDERMGPAGIAPSELLTPEEKAALLTPPSEESGQPCTVLQDFRVIVGEDWNQQAFNDLVGISPERSADLQKAWAIINKGTEDVLTGTSLEESANQAIAETSAAIRASAGGDQEPYAVNAGGSDDFAELRETSAEEAFAPKPPALPAVPAAPGTTALTSSPAGSVTVDKDGLPWDERIHSGSKATNADGTWRKKRGVDAALVTEVEAQLGKLMAPEVPAAPKPPVPPVPGLAPTAAPAPAAPPVPPPPAPVVTVPAGPSSPAPAVSTAEPQVAQAVTFASLFKRVTELKKAYDGKTFIGEDDILSALGQPTWLAIASAKDQALIEAAWGLLP